MRSAECVRKGVEADAQEVELRQGVEHQRALGRVGCERVPAHLGVEKAVDGDGARDRVNDKGDIDEPQGR